MSLEETIRDLHTVLKTDIFTSDNGELGVRGFFPWKERVEQMRKLLRRDKEEIRHAHDATNIKYKSELVGWLTQAGNYLNLRPMDVQRFNSSYENMLAYYAVKVLDQVLPGGTTPIEVVIAHNRYTKYRDRVERGIAL